MGNRSGYYNLMDCVLRLHCQERCFGDFNFHRLGLLGVKLSQVLKVWQEQGEPRVALGRNMEACYCGQGRLVFF